MEIKAVLEAERSHDKATWHELLCPSWALMHAMAVGWGVAIFQQANGSEAFTHQPPACIFAHAEFCLALPPLPPSPGIETPDSSPPNHQPLLFPLP